MNSRKLLVLALTLFAACGTTPAAGATITAGGWASTWTDSHSITWPSSAALSLPKLPVQLGTPTSVHLDFYLAYLPTLLVQNPTGVSQPATTATMSVPILITYPAGEVVHNAEYTRMVILPPTPDPIGSLTYAYDGPYTSYFALPGLDVEPQDVPLFGGSGSVIFTLHYGVASASGTNQDLIYDGKVGASMVVTATIQYTPEPSGCVLMGLGLALTTACIRRRSSPRRP